MNDPSSNLNPMYRGAHPASLDRRRFAKALAGSAALAIVGCAGIEPSMYQAEKPTLDLKTYFR